MSERLGSVSDYIQDIRTMLLDKMEPYRYSNEELLVAFNTCLLEGARLRPDLFFTKYGNRVPYYEAITGEEVPIEPKFRLSFVYGTAAHALARDDEDVQDQRANTFRDVFESFLIGKRVAPIQGGTPGPANANQ